jgi:hypothetical protein
MEFVDLYLRLSTFVMDLYLLNTFGILDLIFCSVSDEDGLASPFDDNVLAQWDRREVDFDFGLGEHVGGRSHIDEEICTSPVLAAFLKAKCQS